MSRSVVVVSTEFPPGPGGIGTHAEQLSRRLHGLGWRVEVVTPQDHVTAAEVAAWTNRQPYPVHRAIHRRGAAADGLTRARLVRAVLRRVRPDVVVATGARSAWLVAALAGHRPWVLVGHGTEFGAGPAGRLTGLAAARADLVVAVSDFTLGVITGAGVQARRAVVVRNGGDDEVFGPGAPGVRGAVRARLGLSGDAPLVATVGQVSPRKAQDVVVRALAVLADRRPDVHYAIAGLPTDGDRIAALAADLGVADRVHLLGRLPTPEVVELYQACDVNVLVSRTAGGGDVEGFGIAAVEAALCGAPSVVSEASGLVEAVARDETALVVPPDDPAATAEALDRLLGDDELRRRMGAAAAARATADQTWRGVVARYAELLDEVAVSGRRTAPRTWRAPSRRRG